MLSGGLRSCTRHSRSTYSSSGQAGRWIPRVASCSVTVELVGIGVRGVLQSILAVVSRAIQRNLTILEDCYCEREMGGLQGLEGELAILKAQR